MGDMSTILDTLTRDSIDSKAVEESLQYATVKNFHNLYEIQTDICGLTHYDIPFTDMKLVTRLKSDLVDKHYPKRYAYTIPKNIITRGKERACKELELYDVPLTQATISQYPSIFNYNFMIMVDGMFVNTGDIIVSAESIMLTIDVQVDSSDSNVSGIPYERFKEYYDNDEILTLFLLPNYTYGCTSFTNYIYTNTLVKEIPISRFTNRDSINENTTMFFVNNDDDPSLLKRINFSVKSITDTDKRIILDPTVDIVSNNISVVAITFDYLYEQITIRADESRWFQLNDYRLPVPIENIIPMVVNDDGTMSIDTSIRFKLYYPNIYEMCDSPEGKDIILNIFFKDSVDQSYTNDLLLLNILSGDLVHRYETQQLPEVVMNYSPAHVPYFSSDDFINSVFYPNTTLYNIDRFTSIAEVDPDVLLKYIYKKMKYLPRYYVNVSKLDLSTRIRTDTSQEQDSIIDLHVFDEEMYLFSFSKKFIGTSGFDFRIFIDNLFVPMYQYSCFPGADYYHFYIPRRLINSNSIIEFEKHREYDWVFRGTVENNQLCVELPKHLRTYGIFAHDIYVVLGDTLEYVENEQYTITAMNDIIGKPLDLVNDEYAKIYDKFTLQFFPDSVVTFEGKPIIVQIYHKITTSTTDVDVTDKTTFPYEVTVPSYSNTDVSVVRAFGNGLLLPVDAYALSPSGMYGCPASMGFFIDDTFVNGNLNKISVDVLPVGIRCEFKLDYIENDYGFIDTGDSLSSPFDLKWYDVYVNGLKLNKSNIDIVTTNKFFVKGIKSRRNLFIYARGDIYDEFTMRHELTYDNFLFDEVDEIYEELIKNRDILEDTLTDITKGIVEGVRDYYTFVSTVLEYIFINPNKQQITSKIIDAFPELVDETGMLTLVTNVDYLDEIDMITSINSNIRRGIMKKHRYRYSFTPLHIGNHYDAENGEYMCDPITGSPCMKDINGDIIPTGAIDRLNIHKNVFSESLATNNLAHLDMYNLEAEDTAGVREIVSGDNLLENPVTIEQPVAKMCISVDMDILKKGCQDVMTTSGYTPKFEVVYKNGESEEYTTVISMSVLNTTVITVNSDTLTLKSIRMLPENEDDSMEEYKCILHSVLVAF